MRKWLIILLSLVSLQAISQQKIIVAADGSGDYKTVQGAINSLPDSSAKPRTIFIRKGTYAEKYISKKPTLFSKEKTGRKPSSLLPLPGMNGVVAIQMIGA